MIVIMRFGNSCVVNYELSNVSRGNTAYSAVQKLVRSRLLRNVGKFLPDCPASHVRRKLNEFLLLVLQILKHLRITCQRDHCLINCRVMSSDMSLLPGLPLFDAHCTVIRVITQLFSPSHSNSAAFECHNTKKKPPSSCINNCSLLQLFIATYYSIQIERNLQCITME